MYEIVRILISAIVLLLLLFALKKNKKHNRVIISVITACILFIALWYLPFENYFFSFKSAASAYKYYNYPMYKVELVIEGYDSDLVVARSNKGAYHNAPIPKEENGYKIATNIQTGVIEKYRDGYDDIFVDVYYHKDLDDFYLSVRNIDGETLEISDTMSSDFVEYKEADSRYNSGITYYYTCIKSPDSDYRLIINGEKISLDFRKIDTINNQR